MKSTLDDASPIDIALAVCSYWRNTPPELFNRLYFDELIARAEEGLQGIALAESSLYCEPLPPPSRLRAAWLFVRALPRFGPVGAWQIATAYLGLY